ncbi:PREDICTED: intracellular protein transport protein USO1-like isoform X2 [Wasmannia auropunctata]|uniref:intracellular protein transport protein USO1-like isoform X2 n=1 Tax=Wasmannia auropunctata TaxID=64793 RepID=UPI0005EEF358|nr:PREDICTED: intracellular protein transport protein USO1-like isoform X2 [Wasmannia auropunctata]
MELWEKVILEWINCLEVQRESVKSITELHDGVFYISFLKLIKWKKLEEFDQEDIVKFIEEEYPSFKVNKDDNTEHIYIASLLLIHLCRTLSTIYHCLQYNMCDSLKTETQIRVKAFLESILPIGKDITKDTMREVIMEVEDMSTAVESRRTPPIEGSPFANSPLTRSGRSKKILTERVRELRDLKCSLAIERFNNADLRDDISRQHNKIKKLQRKLDEKSAKIKELREDRIHSSTPQPSRTREDNSQEEYYKRYINDLENQLSKQQDEITKLETEKDDMSKELSCTRRMSKHYKENFTSCEQSLETLTNKIELKDRELIELRMHNEELRVHLKELNRNPDQSFEVDDFAQSAAAKSFNTSEVLSTVVEIQLQEAREESAILNAQVDTLKGKLDILTKEYRALLESNRDLQERVKTLDRVQAELDRVQKELDASSTTVANLQVENVALVTQTEDLKNFLSSTEEKLSEVERSNIALNAELDSLKLDTKSLSELFENERANSSNLSTTLAEMKSQVTEHLACIHELTDEKDSYKSSIENCSKSLRDILHCDNQFIQVDNDNLNNSTLNDLTKYIETMLHNCSMMRVSYENDVEKLKTTIDETNANLREQQLTITTLEEQNKQNLRELANIEEEKNQMDFLLNEQKEIIRLNSEKIESLEEIKCKKLILEQSVHELTNNLTNRELLLKHVAVQLKNLYNINKDFKLMKEEIQQNFIEHRKSTELTFEKLQHEYHTLHDNYHKVQQEKGELESNFNCNKEELSKIYATNATLQQNLLENKEKIDTLEEKKRILSNELNESKRSVQELRDINQTLEELYAVMNAESNDKLESLKSDNAKILLELKDATDKLNLLHQEMSDTTTQIELKEAQVNELLSNVSALETEKNDLMRSHKEIFETKDKEIAGKEEELSTLRNKMEKLNSEANVTEKKMKEIIINLQEVRSSQDAILATQEAALKEKCLYIEELQERYDNSKENLNKELEDTKLTLRESRSKFFDLENQLNNQNRTIAELQDMLKAMSAELETSKEHCKRMDASQVEIVKLCQELEHPTKNLNSTITETCSDFDLHDVPQYECINIENKYKCINVDNNANILNIIKMTLEELHKSQKIISHLACVNAKLNETLAQQTILVEDGVKDKEEVGSLKNKIRELEIIAQKRNNYLKNLIKNKESLKESLQKVFATRNDLDTILTSSKQKWNEILIKFQDIFYIENSVCDEFKQLQIKKTSLENTLLKCQTDYSESVKSMSDVLWEKFLWTEQKLHDTYLCSIHEKECLEILTHVEEDQFSNEKTIIDMQLEKYKALQTDAIKSEEEIDSFSTLVTVYDNNLKSGEIKSHVEIEKKLQNQINQMTKEKKDLKTKMDTMRLRNVKLEKNIDDLRTEIRKLKSTEAAPAEASLAISEGSEVQSLKEELERLKEQNQQLHEEKDEASKMAKQKLENQLKEIHATYEQKLEDMKQQMKIAYNEQMTKLSKDQEKVVQEKLQNQMEIMCQRQREELNRYKAHVGELSSQLWSVGEKLLIEQQEKQDALQRLKELEITVKELQTNQPVTISRKTCRMEKKEMLPENSHQAHKVTTVLTEETLERRHSIRSIQTMGNAFKTEDEEEIFDNVYLADMKRGNFMPISDVNRLSVLQMRNSLCKPHLKSSYPAEMQFIPSTLTEEEIKTGSAEENFNDSLSQSLLPEQKARKKDRTQSNEVRSPNSRVLRERNVDRKTTTTPHSLKTIFSLKRQDENATSTPKRRLSNLFRKSRLQSDR